MKTTMPRSVHDHDHHSEQAQDEDHRVQVPKLAPTNMRMAAAAIDMMQAE
jgi:hypothetical protein